MTGKDGRKCKCCQKTMAKKQFPQLGDEHHVQQKRCQEAAPETGQTVCQGDRCENQGFPTVLVGFACREETP